MYKVETITVNGGLLRDAYDKVPEKLQTALNEGTKKDGDYIAGRNPWLW